MRIHATLMSAFLLLTPVAALAQDLPTQRDVVGIRTEGNEMMTRALKTAHEAISAANPGDDIVLILWCPKPMVAVAAMASGAVDLDSGTRLFQRGILEDHAGFMATKITGGAALNLDKAGIKLQVTMGKGVDKAQLLKVIESGMDLMN